MNCPNCNTFNGPGAKFCQNCGNPLPLFCPNCGAPVKLDARFCTRCGTNLQTGVVSAPPLQETPSLPVEASEIEKASALPVIEELPITRLAAEANLTYERRLVTILFADVISYSTLSEDLDPEELVEIMREVYPCLLDPIARHTGTVVQVMGDGVLAFFGAPVSHEDDPERAIRAGLEIQRCVGTLAARLQQERNISGFNVRVGIHTGLVVVGEITPDKHLEYTALGDAVNLAARLQQIAPPGMVLVSHETYRLVRGLFNAQAQEVLTVKGRHQPVQTYLVNSIKAQAWRIRTRGVEGVDTPMVGREPELLALQNFFRDAFQAGESSLALISGDAGLGKSRLMDEFIAWVDLQPEDVWYFRGRATPSTQHTPYAVFRDVFSYRFEILESDTTEQAIRKFRQGVGAHLTPEQADLVGQLVGFDFSSSPAVARMHGDPGFAQLAVIYLTNYFRQLANDPLLIVLEDLHWADNSSLDLICDLLTDMRKSGGAHLMVVGAARPNLWENRPNWGEGVAGFNRMVLRPLSRRSSRGLVEEIFKKVVNLPESLVERIIDETEGSPLFIEELVKMLIEDGVIETSADEWRINQPRLDTLRVPPTLAGILQTRLDSLPPAERQILQRAAVIGRVFWDRLVSVLTADPDEVERVPDRLAALRERELIFRRERSSIAGADEYLFKHSLLQDAAYETVLLKQRRNLHGQVAAWIEVNAGERMDEYQAVIANHYALANQPLPAADWYTCAGQRALGLGASQEACRLFSHSLELLPEDDLERRWLALMGRDEALGVLGELEERRVDDETLLALANQFDDPQRLADAYYNIGSQAHFEGDHVRAQEALDKAITYARQAGNLRQEAKILPLKLFDLIRQGALSEAEPLVAPALEIAARVQDEDILARALTNIAIYYLSTGDLARAAQSTRQVVEINQAKGNLLLMAVGLTNLGYYYLSLGLFDEGQAALERALQAARELEARKIIAYSLLNLGLAYWRLDLTQAAQEALQSSYQELKKAGDQMGMAYYYFYMGLNHEKAGDYTTAEVDYTQAKEAFSRLGALPPTIDAAAALARVYLQTGQTELARQAADETADYLVANGPQGLDLPILAYVSCARVFQALADPPTLERILVVGCQELDQRTARLEDPEAQRAFFEAIPEHHELINFPRDWQPQDAGKN